MTYKYNNVYIGESSTVAGPYEGNGPLENYFDKIYKELSINEKSFEKAEVRLMQDSIDILLNKQKILIDNVDLIVAGDLLNQITASCYAVEKYKKPFLGLYSACATSVEGIIIASTFIDSKKIKTAIAATSSHNLSSERQFRNPVEYGAPRPSTATFTATGGASIFLTNKKTDIKVEASTIGKVINMNQTDPLNMGAVMAPAAADTIYNHLNNLNRKSDYYDLILTGDLGIYGRDILREVMQKEYNINLNNYNDCGVMLYDLERQKEVLAGGSGPVCSALVNYSLILNKLRKKELKRVLLVATGALFSPTFAFQKQPILSIAHAVSLEVVE